MTQDVHTLMSNSNTDAPKFQQDSTISDNKYGNKDTSMTLQAGLVSSAISKKSPNVDVSVDSEKISKVMSDSVLDVRDFGTCAPAMDDIDRYFKSSSRQAILRETLQQERERAGFREYQPIQQMNLELD